MRRLSAVLGAALLVAVSCGQTPPSTGTSPSPAASASETPQAGGRVVYGATGDPKTMQPVISTDTTSSFIWGWFYLGLTRANYKTGETEPSLAEKFELSKDGLTLTYTLRDNLVWSDGSPFTGEDYKYTVEAVARSVKTVRKSTFQDIVGWADYRDGKTDSLAGITLSNNGKTIEIKFTKVFCPATAAMGSAGGGILPSKFFKTVWNNKTTDTKTNIDDNALNMSPPASMGPFVFKEFKPGVQVTLARNDKYFRGAPLIEEFVVKNYADATAIKNALVTGEVTYYPTVEAKDYEEVSKVDALKGVRYKLSSYTYIGWNAKAAKAPWLANRDVRQALWYGINVDAIMKKILFGLGTQVYAHNPPVSWAYDASGLTQYSNDVAKAKSLLEKAGAKIGTDGVYRWTDGQPMKMRIETNQGNNARETILQFAQEQYKAIGIQIDPLLESFNALLDRTDPGTDYEGFIIGWSLGADPDPYSIWHSSQQGKGQFNNVGYNNPAVDQALLDNRNGPDCSQTARKAALKKVDSSLNQDAPYTFLYSADALFFANKQLQGLDPNTYSNTWNIEKWWFKK
ncbi:MAG TPA: ABC transporter substrate-binding protein [Candidatus Limnocylindria bacterium]|nr:ABC transporter substrate-binding protein [Candidatus Limnocylindria bacterium]